MSVKVGVGTLLKQSLANVSLVGSSKKMQYCEEDNVEGDRFNIKKQLFLNVGRSLRLQGRSKTFFCHSLIR